MSICFLLVSLGAALGFAGSVPPAGPGSALLIQLSSRGSRPGSLVAFAFGCAAGEGLYAAIGTTALGWLVGRFPIVSPIVAGIGFVALAACGVQCAVMASRRGTGATGARTDGRGPDWRELSWRRALVWGATAALANPMPLASWSTTFGLVVSVLGVDTDVAAGIGFALGASVGVFAWMSLLGVAVARLSRKWGPSFDRWLLRGTAVALLCACAGAAVSTLRG